VIQASKVLILAPHTDDGELGCGATISLLLEQGKEVHYIALSSASDSLPPGTPKDQLVVEVKQATQILGIKPENLKILNYQVRKLNYYRQELLEFFVSLRDELNPDLIFVPSRSDLHQDHATVTMEALRAFKQKTILGYELPWNNLSFDADCFICLEPHHVNAKVNALSEYKTQAHRDYMSPSFIRSLATVRGTQMGVQYAESFEVIRMRL